MVNSTAFDWLADELEATTSLDRLEARGTLRLTLKSTGLEPATVSARELSVVLDRVMPAEMASRGISRAAQICSDLAERIDGIDEMNGDAGQADSPADVFARLG